MKKLSIILAATALAIAAVASAAVTGNPHDDHPDTNPHAHVMLTHFELIEGGDTATTEDDVVSFGECIDLANNQELPLRAHHHSLHRGTAGAGNLDVGVTQAGHAVIPLEPYEFAPVPFDNCAGIEAIFG